MPAPRLGPPADATSRLAGTELVARKCRLLVMMAGMFADPNRQKEYNVFIDLDATVRGYLRTRLHQVS